MFADQQDQDRHHRGRQVRPEARVGSVRSLQQKFCQGKDRSSPQDLQENSKQEKETFRLSGGKITILVQSFRHAGSLL